MFFLNHWFIIIENMQLRDENGIYEVFRSNKKKYGINFILKSVKIPVFTLIVYVFFVLLRFKIILSFLPAAKKWISIYVNSTDSKNSIFSILYSYLFPII
jgi:hypothetical protein